MATVLNPNKVFAFFAEGIKGDNSNIGKAARGAHYLMLGALNHNQSPELAMLGEALEEFSDQPFQYDPENPEKTLTLGGVRLLLGHRDFAIETSSGDVLRLDKHGEPNFEITALDHGTLVRDETL